MNHAPRYRAIAVLLVVLPLTGCLFRSRKVQRQVSAAPFKFATQQELIDYLNSQAAKIRTMQATVDIDTSVGGAQRGKVTDYQQIRGYVLARKPAMLRMIGLMPIVRNRAFDMVSDGKEFKLWIPAKNKFVIGRNDRPTPNARQALENVRPQAIYDALLLPEISPDEIAVLENGYETVTDAKHHRIDQPDYELEVIRKGEHAWYLSRKIVFSRTDLLPHRQFLYNQNGESITDATYENYRDYSGVSFPTQIGIYRPQEEYDITLSIVKLQLNQLLSNDQFVLQQPPGADVVHLDQPPASQARTTNGSDAK